jgi:hypothetical protein
MISLGINRITVMFIKIFYLNYTYNMMTFVMKVNVTVVICMIWYTFYHDDVLRLV